MLMHRMANAMADTPETPPVTKDDRRTYDSGSLYQRTSDWRWIGAVDAGYTATGARKRVTVTGKGCVGGCKKKCPHIGAMRRKVDRKYQEVRRGEHVPIAFVDHNSPPNMGPFRTAEEPPARQSPPADT